MASYVKYIECVLLIEEHREQTGNGRALLSEWPARGSVMAIISLEGILALPIQIKNARYLSTQQF